MVIGIIGENCTGKSTIAEKLKNQIGGEIYTGKDYLRMGKNDSIALKLFQKKLTEAVNVENIIYVISEQEHISLLPEKAVRILVTEDLEQIKKRFSQRMHGNLPAPVAAMLEKNHGCFDNIEHDIHIVSGVYDLNEVCADIQN